MYKENANYIKTGEPISHAAEIAIEKLKIRPVILSTITQSREDKLRETIRRFECLQSQGFSKAEAARKLGYDDYPTIWKIYREIERIDTENKTKNNFKNSLRINTNMVKKTPDRIVGDETIQEVEIDEPEN